MYTLLISSLVIPGGYSAVLLLAGNSTSSGVGLPSANKQNQIQNTSNSYHILRVSMKAGYYVRTFVMSSMKSSPTHVHKRSYPTD